MSKSESMAPAALRATCSTTSTTPRTVALGYASELTKVQRGLLEKIDAVMQGMQQPDFECFNNEVVRRPVWEQLRELAVESLRAFDWEQVVVRPFVEVQPGIWHKPHAEAE